MFEKEYYACEYNLKQISDHTIGYCYGPFENDSLVKKYVFDFQRIQNLFLCINFTLYGLKINYYFMSVMKGIGLFPFTRVQIYCIKFFFSF